VLRGLVFTHGPMSKPPGRSGCLKVVQTTCACVCHTGEKYWRMPLDPDLKSKLESPIADLKNYAGESAAKAGGGPGGGGSCP
jgi:hypothetical protein